jgi:hypothetical protein
VKIDELHRLPHQRIHVRRLAAQIAMIRQVAVTLVVGQEENDVRPPGGRGHGELSRGRKPSRSKGA